MKNILKALFARNVAPPVQAEFMQIFEILPNFPELEQKEMTAEKSFSWKPEKHFSVADADDGTNAGGAHQKRK